MGLQSVSLNRPHRVLAHGQMQTLPLSLLLRAHAYVHSDQCCLRKGCVFWQKRGSFPAPSGGDLEFSVFLFLPALCPCLQ